MTKISTIRVKRTPNCLHAYTATMKGKGTYGWGNTPNEARAKLKEQLRKQIEGEGRYYSASMCKKLDVKVVSS